jgi:hypothetical protein
MWGNTVTICSVLKKKTTKLNSQSAQYEKNKIEKDHFGEKKKKNNNKNGKKNHVRKNYSNPQCFKEKNYKVKFSTSSISKKKSTKIILKRKKKRRKSWGKKNIWRKL